MITYLVNFTLCSAMLLLAYHLLLKNKAMYVFNRFYLLASLVLSVIVPLISVRHNIAPLPSFSPVEQQLFIAPDQTPAFTVPVSHADAAAIAQQKPVNYLLYITVVAYALVALILITRFIINLYSIRRSLSGNKKISYKWAFLVLIDEQLTPHTFLNFIFLNQADYEQQKIENDILKHELAHARQLHSIDVIFIELLQAICWFNPFLLLYKNAIQLNHEFIADAAVLNDSNNITGYQHLLLNKLTQVKSLNITSRFNYSVTKKRLIMMNKTTPALTALFSRLSIIPVIAAAFMLFCIKVDALPAAKLLNVNKPLQIKPLAKHVTIEPIRDTTRLTFPTYNYPYTKEGVSPELMAEYSSIVSKYAPDTKAGKKFFKKVPDNDKARLEEIYKQMSLSQQRRQTILFAYPPPPLHKSKPTQKQLNLWANAKKYGVWVNEKRISNDKLIAYNPDDFGQLFMSILSPVAVRNDKFQVQVDLMTKDYYQQYLKQALADRHKSMILFRSPI
jgi:bla regulator protein BlaR1